MDSISLSVKSVTTIADELNPKKWLYHRIIITTTSQAGVIFKHRISPNHFSHVFVDEAAQVTEPETLVPISLSDVSNGVIVLAGDHKQLGPVIQSQETMFPFCRLERSLMERLMTIFQCYERNGTFRYKGYYNPKFVVKLINNHRSHPHIMAVPSKLFYENELQYKTRADHLLILCSRLKSAVNFHGVIGLSVCHLIISFYNKLIQLKGQDFQDGEWGSWYNPQEVLKVCSYLERLLKSGVKPEDIGL